MRWGWGTCGDPTRSSGLWTLRPGTFILEDNLKSLEFGVFFLPLISTWHYVDFSYSFTYASMVGTIIICQKVGPNWQLISIREMPITYPLSQWWASRRDCLLGNSCPGIDIYTLLYIKSITNKDLLYSTGNSTQYSVIAYVGKESKKRAVQSLSRVQLSFDPMPAACQQAPLSMGFSWQQY